MTEPKPKALQKSRGRPKGSKNKFTEDFDKAYQKYSRAYGIDPVEFLFRVMSGADKSEDWGTTRLTAAVQLVNRKVPVLKSIDANVKSEESKQLVIVWEDEENHSTVQTEAVSEGLTH
jgi:hypothetical protein